MTNAGMVLPQPGFLEALRAACTRHGVPLALDETHTLSSGFGGYARAHGLAADFLVCGKAIAGGLPCAVFGYSEAIAARIRAADARREPGHSGIGTTLAANPHGHRRAACQPRGRGHRHANHRLMEQGAARLARGWHRRRVARPAARTGR